MIPSSWWQRNCCTDLLYNFKKQKKTKSTCFSSITCSYIMLRWTALWGSNSIWSPTTWPNVALRPYPSYLSPIPIWLLSNSLNPPVEENQGGAKTPDSDVDASWLRMGTDETEGFCGELPNGLLLLELLTKGMEGGCWLFCGGDFGRRLSISGVVATKWGASGGGFRPPPPCQTLPSLSVKFLRYPYAIEKGFHQNRNKDLGKKVVYFIPQYQSSRMSNLSQESTSPDECYGPRQTAQGAFYQEKNVQLSGTYHQVFWLNLTS